MAKAVLSKGESKHNPTGARSKVAPPYIAPPPPPPPLPTRSSSQTQLFQRLQRAETEANRVWTLHSQAVQEIHRINGVIQTQTQELQRAREESQDLRDLCCFLDDERQKGRKLAREWQRFGRYTAAVMRQEVACYQGKLTTLEERQERLLKDNLELKELCLYLDEERQDPCPGCGHRLGQDKGAPACRGDADGSSTGTVTAEEVGFQREDKDRKRSLINEQVLGYVRTLERRLANAESNLKTKSTRTQGEGEPRRPRSITQALQVLEVCQQMEDGATGDSGGGDSELETEGGGGAMLGEGERALVRHMCNVVWKKLEEEGAS